MVSWRLAGKLVWMAVLCSLVAPSCSSFTVREDSRPPELPYAAELQKAIDQVLVDVQSEYDLGVSAAMIVPGYQAWSSVSGVSHPGVPITGDMLFDAGSIEKNFEATLVLQLAEEGWLSLDDPISMYLPDLTNVDRKITIRQLLDHTSGVFNVFEHPEFPWVGTGVVYAKRWALEEVFSNFVLDPYSPPGYAQHYSSTNYLLLTEIIEVVTQSSVPNEIEHRYLHPLQLEHTFISMGDAPAARYSVAHPWVDINQDGILEDLYGIPLIWKVSLTHPVMFSTPSDLVRWINALYHEKTVLSPHSLGEMLTYPETTRRDPEGALYGLGVVDYSDLLGVQVYGHGGSSLGYCGAALYLPEYGISLAWLVNTGESPPALADRIMSNTWTSLWEVIWENIQ